MLSNTFTEQCVFIIILIELRKKSINHSMNRDQTNYDFITWDWRYGGDKSTKTICWHKLNLATTTALSELTYL